jgi:hypothetical protein
MSFSQELIGVSIVGFSEAQGPGENPLFLSRDGSAPAASIAIPVGERLVISDWINAGDTLTPMRLQKTTDGGLNWFDIALMQTGANDSNKMNLETPFVIDGGVGVAIRVLCNPGIGSGTATVMSTLRCESQV